MHDLYPSIRRSGRGLGLLSGVALGALFGAGQPVQALVINSVFDTSWTTSAPAGATADVNHVIAEYEADFSNPVTVTVSFGWGTLNNSPINPNGGGVTNFPSQNPQYTLAQVKTQYATAVGSPGATSALVTANANLPATYTNPGGSTSFFVPDAEFKALTGGAQNADPVNAFTGYGTTPAGLNWDFSGGVPPVNEFDFTSVVEHEVAHALGRVDWAFQSGVANGPPPKLSPLNFFTYDCPSPNTTLDPRFNITCFSIDGGNTNPGGRTFSNVSDSGDWINFGADSYNESITNGVQQTVSNFDLLEMCALGWNDRAACGTPVTPTPEPGTLALLGTSLLGLVALRRRRR
jgi:PEP-CTERM motif